MIKDRPVSYKVGDKGLFSINNYSLAKPFSNFLPGVAGPNGIPLWVFYVNRGQGIASFGVRDKDHSILQFVPANRAYEDTAYRGFRTFIKNVQKKDSVFYEPFQNTLHNQPYEIRQSMHIRPWGFSIEERNMTLGLEVIVDYFALSNEPLPILARKVTFKNVSFNPLELEVLDGLPGIVPFGVNDFFLKNMSRTIESWMHTEISCKKEKVVFYKLTSDPQDRPEYQSVDGAHFYTSFMKSTYDRAFTPEYIVDPVQVFGVSQEFFYPREFLKKTPFHVPLNQVCEGRTPSAFTFVRMSIQPSEEKVLYSYIGETRDQNLLFSRLAHLSSSDGFEKKRAEKEKVICQIQAPAQTISAYKEYDGYCAQTYLDNALRGGYPSVMGDKKRSLVFPLYSRKHGDLERDYNRFVLDPTYLSQGESNFRDVNQNRRCDHWFEPSIGASNIKMFFNLIQSDGFNPLVVKPVKLIPESMTKIKHGIEPILRSSESESLVKFLKKPRTPGDLMKYLEDASPATNARKHEIFNIVISFSRKVEDGEHETGFWTDHWHYNLDMLESYLAIYPDDYENLIFREKDYTFYDNDHYVKPRSQKIFRLSDGKIRQLKAVDMDKQKKELIGSRTDQPRKARTRFGKGKIYETTLIVKMLSLAANKYGSLDPSGMGVEMEADRPGWMDSLNGLPSLFGSSSAETFELVRLIDIIQDALNSVRWTKKAAISLPVELFKLLQKFSLITQHYLNSRKSSKDFTFWDETHEAKEDYWEETRLGFRGTEKKIPVKRLKKIISLFSKKLSEKVDKMYDASKEVCPTYFVHDVTDYREEKSYSKKVIVPKAFKRRALPIFLEGPVHAMKVEKNPAKLHKIYNAVRSSDLFDRKIGMYKVCTNLVTEPLEIGRVRAFMRGWLENEAVFTHMEYKFLLQTLKNGMHDAFYTDFKAALVAFQDPKVYGRSIFENCSFIASSACPDKHLHGNGFIARLSGATAEFLDMWLTMNVGSKPFSLDEEGKLSLRIAPILAPWLFTENDINRTILFKNGQKLNLFLPKNSFAFVFMGNTVITYHNPKRKATYGSRRAIVKRISFQDEKGKYVMVSADTLSSPYSRQVREGRIQRLDVELG